MPVDYMMSILTTGDYLRWQKFYSMEPFGSIRQDFRIGTICSTLFNTIRSALGGDKDDKPTTYADFVPTYDSILLEQEKESIDNMNSGLGSAFALLRAQATK